MANDWFCKIGDRQFGPFSLKKIQALIAEGKLRAEHQLKHGGEGTWFKVGELGGLLANSGATGEPVPIKPTKPPHSAAQTKGAEHKPKTPPTPTEGSKQPSPGRPKKRRAQPRPPFPPPRDVRQATTDEVDVPVLPRPVAVYPTPQSPRLSPAPSPAAIISSAGGRSGPMLALRRRNSNRVLLISAIVAVAASAVLAVATWVVMQYRNQVDSAAAVARKDEKPPPKPKIEEPDIREPVPPKSSESSSGGGGEKSPPAGKSSGERGELHWADARRETLTQGNVAVRIKSAKLGFPKLLEGVPASSEPFLLLTIEVKHVGTSGSVEYKSWSTSTGRREGAVVMTDNAWRPWPMARFNATVAGQVPRAVLEPQTAIEDLLVFRKQGEGVQYVRLELPAAAIGERSTLRFHIPSAMIDTSDETAPGRVPLPSEKRVDPDANPPPARGEEKPHLPADNGEPPPEREPIPGVDGGSDIKKAPDFFEQELGGLAKPLVGEQRNGSGWPDENPPPDKTQRKNPAAGAAKREKSKPTK
jgi:hypothetical protein